MEKEIKTATLIDDEGTEFELEVIKEFEYNGKNYAVLYEDGSEESDEDEDDETEDDNEEVANTEELEDDDDSDDEESCDEDDECDGDCGEECTCGCHDEDEGHMYILEVVKDEKGNDVYNEVEESLMEQLIPIVEKELYLTEE